MKKIVICIAVAITGACGVFQANNNIQTISQLQIKNLEALADGEDPRGFKYVYFDSSSYKLICQDPGTNLCN